MQTTASNIRLNFDEKNKPELTLSLNLTRSEAMSKVHELKQPIEKGKKLSVEVKPHRNKRSLDANNYCWVLCQKIAEAIESTKEQVYQKVIRDVGQWDDFPIIDEAVEVFIRRWNNKGLGDFAEIQRPSRIEGYTVIRAYHGSSVYDTKEMSVLINELVIQAQELDIETRPEAEINALLNEWESKNREG